MRPRQSSSGASPAQPIATSDWPWRQARPNESVITTAGATPVSSRRRRAQRARRARRGRAGAARPGSSPGTFEASTPALAHTKPWCVTQISTPRSARRISRDSSSTTCTWRGSLPTLGGELAARGRRRHLAERAHPALGLRDDLVGDRDDVAVAQRRLVARAGAISAARSVPGAISGRPSSAAARSAPAVHELAAARCSWCSIPRVWAAPPRRPRALAAARRGPRACRRRAPARRPRRPRGRCRPTPAPLQWRCAAAGAEAPAPSASGGVSSSAFVPVPWRSGDDHAQRSARARRPSRASSSSGSSSGQSPGDEQHPVGARLERGGGCRARAAGLWPLLGIVEHARAVAAGDLLRARDRRSRRASRRSRRRAAARPARRRTSPRRARAARARE